MIASGEGPPDFSTFGTWNCKRAAIEVVIRSPEATNKVTCSMQKCALLIVGASPCGARYAKNID